MPAYPRAELEEMVERWLQANRDAEAAGDWKPMAELYTPDATYGWNYGPDTDFMAVGRERDPRAGPRRRDGRPRRLAVPVPGDPHRRGQGPGRRLLEAGRRRHPCRRPPLRGGRHRRQWFRYGGDLQWSWQRDWFDFGNAAALFMEMMSDGKLSDGMTARMHRSMKADRPGYYPAFEAPVQLWDVP